MIGWVLALAVFIFVLVIIVRSIRIIPQATAGVVERLGRYHKTLMPGLNLLVPFIDRVRPLIDMREQVVSFPPQPVITEDNLVVSIDTVIYFQVTDARAATYEIANYLGAVEQLTTTTLRNVVGGLNLEEALTSRDNINGQLRVVLDEATGKWGIRVGRVELKAIDPPHSIQDSMEKQMRAERDRRALILTAEGTKQSAILTAEGQRQAEILKAEGDKQAAVLRAQGEAEAIEMVFNAIHGGDADEKLLAYQYLQTLPKIADSASSKLWIVPERAHRGAQGHRRRVLGAARREQADDARPVTRHPYLAGAALPRVLAHRGLVTADAAGHGIAENSFAAVAAAHAAGALYIESDCHRTSDGAIVLFHDASLERVTGDRRLVAEVTERELEQLMAPRGGLITLAQALDAFPGVRFNLDVKAADAAASVGRIVAPHADRVLVTSFSDARRRAALDAAVDAGAGIRPATSAGSRTILDVVTAVSLRSAEARGASAAGRRRAADPRAPWAAAPAHAPPARCRARPRRRGARVDRQRRRSHAPARRDGRRRRRHRPRGRGTRGPRAGIVGRRDSPRTRGCCALTGKGRKMRPPFG